MSGTLERVKARQGLFAKIQNFFTMGYGTKEDLRELDKQLRDLYWDDLRELRHRWEKAYLEAIDAGQAAVSRSFKRAIQTLDRVSAMIQRGDYGYAGLFDRKGSIREPELARVFDYDRALGESLDKLKEAVSRVQSDVKAKSWSAVSEAVDVVRDAIQELEDKWKERERRFRQLEV